MPADMTQLAAVPPPSPPQLTSAGRRPAPLPSPPSLPQPRPASQLCQHGHCACASLGPVTERPSRAVRRRLPLGVRRPVVRPWPASLRPAAASRQPNTRRRPPAGAAARRGTAGDRSTLLPSGARPIPASPPRRVLAGTERASSTILQTPTTAAAYASSDDKSPTIRGRRLSSHLAEFLALSLRQHGAQGDEASVDALHAAALVAVGHLAPDAFFLLHRGRVRAHVPGAQEPVRQSRPVSDGCSPLPAKI